MTLRREVEIPALVIRARRVMLAVIACMAVLLASQQCAGQVRTRLDAAIARDPLPARLHTIACDVADVAREVRRVRRTR